MTQSTNVAALDHSIEKTNRWLKELSAELQVDRDDAYDVLRGYLHAVRDCLSTDEASDLAAQLPMVVRGEMEDVYAQLPNDVREVIEAV